MRKASLVIGIVGSAFALLAAGIYSIIAFMRDSLFPLFPFYGGPENNFVRFFGGYSALWITAAATAALALILGIIACVLLRKRHVAAAVLLFIAALLTVLSSFLATLLFVLSGIFALVKSRQPLPAPYPPGWAAAYPPYGTQAAPPYPYPPYGTQAAPPYPYPPYEMQAAPLPPQYPLYGANPPPAAPAPNEDNIKEEL